MAEVGITLHITPTEMDTLHEVLEQAINRDPRNKWEVDLADRAQKILEAFPRRD